MEPVELPAVRFANPEGFTFIPLMLDSSGIEMQFRMVQSGYTASGICNFLVTRYASPTLDYPSYSVEMEQRDLAASKVIPRPSLSYEGRQKARLVRHQQLYPEHHRDASFHHAGTEIVDLESLAPSVMLDSWQGNRRLNHLVRAARGRVRLVVLLSGLDKAEALNLLKRLVSARADKSLADWHDAQQEVTP